MSVRRSRFLVMALGAALLAAPLIGAARAKKPKSRLSATINGKRLKAFPGVTLALYSGTSFSVNGRRNPERG